MIQVGDLIHAVGMAKDSFYVQAIGTVTKVENGFVYFQATTVMDRYSKRWSQHPTSCATSTKFENVKRVEAETR